MSAREAFGPNLRRLRIQRGITLEQIAAETKVNIALWSGLERNDLSRWPTGIYARSYIRTYAELIGADADATVDDFCRLFPNGDRRAERVIREQAQIVGHSSEWRDQMPPEADRRGGADGQNAAPRKPRPFAALLRRVLSRA